MKKYKTLLIILFVFLCCLALYSAYRIAGNAYSIWYLINGGWYMQYVWNSVFSLFINLCGEAIAVFGTVTLAKVFQDKQLFTIAEQTPQITVEHQNMKKHKTMLKVLFVFLCCLALLAVYGAINNVYSIWFEASRGNSYLGYLDVILQLVLWLLINLCGVAFSVLGIVTLAKIFQDKQLFQTSTEQIATPTAEERTIENDSSN